MAPIRPTDAPANNSSASGDDLQSQKDFSPLQKGGYEDVTPVSGNKMGSSDSQSATDIAMAAGSAAVKGYLTGNYSQAVVDILDQFGVVDSNAKPADYDSRMMEGVGKKDGIRANLDKLRGETDTISGVEQKETTGMTETLTRIAESLKNLDRAQIAAKFRDLSRELIKSDVKDGPKIVSEITRDLDKYRPEVAKRAKFNEAMAALAEDFPDSFQASQELMQAAFKMAHTGKFDRDDLSQLAQDAAKEFADDPNGDAAKRFRALSEQLKADYGINITMGSKGLEITNEAEGTTASMVRVDGNGVMTGNIDIGPGGTGASVPPEVALKNIVETRREHALDMGKKEAPKPMIIEGIGDKIKPNGEEWGGKEMPKLRPLPQKRYQFGNGHPLNLEVL